MPPIDIDDERISELLKKILDRYGYDFTDYAGASFRRRINYFMSRNKITDLQVLEDLLLNNENKFNAFIEDISVTVTEMFRDPSFFKCLREIIGKRLATYPFIKIWVAGCATGEEAYSLAILLKEEGLLDRSLIYATDINQHSLQVARDGVYPLRDMKEFTIAYQKSGGARSFSEYYLAKYDSALLDKSLKENIVFAHHNLAVDKSFNEFQLILCRNVLIYFNQQLQNRVINLFYESLCRFGILALGTKESLLFSDKKSRFEVIEKREKIYMKSL